MKKQIIYSLLALTTVCLGACNNNDEIDTANSIFSTEPLERNAFDYWLLDNYTYPYNIDFMYRMKDIESDHKYNLVPADYDKAVALSKIIKHVWLTSNWQEWIFSVSTYPRHSTSSDRPPTKVAVTWCSARQKAGRKSPSIT